MRHRRDTSRAATLIAITCGFFFVAGCRDAGGDLYEVEGKLFVFNYRVATATYLVKLNPFSPMRDGTVAVARFDDPAGGEPIVVEQRIWPKLGKVTIESPPLSCVRKDHRYAVRIAIRDGDGKDLQVIETTLVSDLDQSILPDRPLVVGPVYTPNPELAGRPGGKLDPKDRRTCPPAG